MKMRELQEAFAKLVSLPFPRPPEDDVLTDWIMDLLEADAFYAGLADSALAGGRIQRPPAEGLAELAARLDSLRVDSPEDQAILESCRTYFDALQALERALRGPVREVGPDPTSVPRPA